VRGHREENLSGVFAPDEKKSLIMVGGLVVYKRRATGKPSESSVVDL
jgi:hypothetical protein